MFNQIRRESIFKLNCSLIAVFVLIGPTRTSISVSRTIPDLGPIELPSTAGLLYEC